MTELKIEATTKSFEEDPRVREYVERNIAIIESLLENIDTKLGEGNTADVHFLDSNKELCLKVLKNPEEIGVFYNRLEKEMGFLAELQNIDEYIKIPKPYLTADYDGIKCLLMETLNAHSVRDILEGKGQLPEGFNIEAFYNQLKNFLEKMHEKNIYHRDFHAGNIMINPNNGEISVIDFGGSTRSYGEDNPYVEKGTKSSFFTKDEDHLMAVYRDLKKHMLTNRE